KSRLVDLGRFWSHAWPVTLHQGEGEDLWATSSDPWRTVLRFREGAFEAVPALGRPIRSLLKNVLVSPRGRLHASAGRVLHRLDAGGWTPVAILPPGRAFEQMVMDEQGTLWVSSGRIRLDEQGIQAGVASEGVRRLRPGPAAAPSGCATPFV